MRPYLRVANVFEDRIDLTDVMQMHFEPREVERYELKPDDILLNEGQSRELVGRPAMYRGELPGACFTNSLVRFQVSEVVEPRFALQLFRHWLKSGAFLPLVQITTNIAHLGAGRFATMDFPLPPLNEQRRIVAKLEDLLARIERAKDALGAIQPLLEKFRQSVLAAAFRGDLTADWRGKNPDVEPAEELLKRIRLERRKNWEEATLAKMRAKGKAPTDDRWKEKYKEPESVDTKRLQTLPDGWAWASVEELAEVGTGATPKRGEDKYYSGGTIAWVTSGALNQDVVSEATEFVTERALSETNLRIYPAGTLLMAMYGEGKTRGMVAELILPATTNQAIAAICLTGVASQLRSFLKLALFENYERIRLLSSGGVQPNLNLEKVRAIAVPVCPAAELSVLAGAVTSALERISGVQAVLARAGERAAHLESALLAKAFRGELVPQDPGDEHASVLVERIRTERAKNGEGKPGGRKTKNVQGEETSA
jgi:type I restriction enzyme S subunit